ncbi:putative LEA domain protein [Rosellinia necatrix]|uniref:Putative LEA domain protein n=1 Tax=Rosellinia necatrix TaxID=77044 RepID=A0A1W2TVU1_ROSNE|nr:putative LEA domain protein [Rosellinia necatrix]
MTDKEETPVPLPSAPLVRLAGNATLQPPLTRRGHGPGLVIVTCGGDLLPVISETRSIEQQEEGSEPESGDPKTLDPLPQKKWAEEGYAVVQLDFQDGNQGSDDWDIEIALGRAIEALKSLETCDVKDRFGLIVYAEPADYAPAFARALRAAYEAEARLVASVSFSASWDLSQRAELVHVAGAVPPEAATTGERRPNTRRHDYPSAGGSAWFVVPSPGGRFRYAAAGVSHTRSLSFLRAALGGPAFDLEAVWDEHTAYEFAARSVARTMGTMVDAPYVNHVPVLTGGLGRAALTAFYRDRFVFSNPADAALELVSRTVGADRVVDEFVFSLTHDRVVDWLLPGVPPTHKHLRIPFVAVVNIRGDRLYHEHIHWDQGTALAQAGLLPAYLPFPYALPGGRAAGPGKRLEYRVPVAAGTDAAAKLEDAGTLPSNGMFEYAVREVDV